MAELETVAIHSPKDESQMWLINASDYDPTKHRLWGEEPVVAQAAEADAAEEPEDEMAVKLSSVPEEDRIANARGQVTGIYIVHPDDARRRAQVAVADYDPDSHTLWSQRGAKE